MRELDAEFRRADSVAVSDDAGQRRLAIIGIEPKAAVGDAAAPLHVGRLDHDKPGAGIGQHAEMGDVPVGRDAVGGAVLAHRGDNNAVGQFKIGKPDRREQGARHG